MHSSYFPHEIALVLLLEMRFSTEVLNLVKLSQFN
jgi:hypothetical protein